MQVLPSTESLRVLLAWSEVVEAKHRWVPVSPEHVPALAELSEGELDACIAELLERGCCTRAANGVVLYITGEGAKLARAARAQLARGVALADLTLEALWPTLARTPFFRLPAAISEQLSSRNLMPAQ